MRTDSPIDGTENADRIESILLDRHISSIYDIAYLYGKLHGLHLSLEYQDAGVKEKYIKKRLTPEQRTGYFDQEIGMVSVPIDITGDDPEITSAGEVFDENDELAEGIEGDVSLSEDFPIVPEPLTPERLLKVGYSRQNSRASGHNMSLAHDVAGKDAEKCGKYVSNIFDRWLLQDQAEEVAEGQEDGDILNGLQTLARNTDEDELKELVGESLAKLVDGNFTGVISLRIKTDPDGDYKYPGEIPVLNKVTHRRWIEKQMRSYSEAKDSSGEGFDFITGEEGEVFGVSDSPLERHQGKMAETFPDLSTDESWRNRPLTEDSAFAVISGSDIISNFVQIVREDTLLYIIPYLEDPSPDEAVALYEMARDAKKNDGKIVSLIKNEVNDFASPLYGTDLRFYYSMVYEPGRKAKILTEEPAASLNQLTKIADQHAKVLSSNLFEGSPDEEPLFPSPPYGRLNTEAGENSSEEGDYQGSEYLMVDTDVVISGLLHGGYFGSTFIERNEDSEDDNYGATDPQIRATRGCITPDEGISVQWVLEQYVPRLEKEQRKSFGEGDLPIPDGLLTRQYVQLQTLAAADVLESSNRGSETTSITEPIEIPSMTKEKQKTEIKKDRIDRENRLKEFIESNPALEQNEERRGSFLLGGLVGRVAAYQKSSENLSRTVIEQHPIDALTHQRFSTTLSQVMDKNATYASREENAGLLMNSRYIDRLNDIVNGKPPTEWSISTEDLRMHYALGISYGVSDGSYSEEEEEQTE